MEEMKNESNLGSYNGDALEKITPNVSDAWRAPMNCI